MDGAAVENVNLDKTYIKPLNTQAVHGGAAQGTNTLTANGEYTIAAAANGNSTNGLLFGKAVTGDFILSAKISTPTDMRTEVGVQINSAATDILMFRFHTWNGGTSMYGWGSGLCGLDNEAGMGKTFDKTGFVYTLVRKDNVFYMIIDGTLWKTYSGSYTTTDSWGKGIDLASIGAVDVELAIRGTTTGNKFSEYSFSTSAADIDAAITAVVDTGVWNDADGNRTVTGVTDGKAYLGDSVVITVTPQENKIIKVFANGTALSGAINGDSYVYTYKVNSTAKITFSYEVTNFYAVSGNVTSDLSGATIKVTDAAIAAARHGAKTALVQDRPVLGGNASSEIRMHICGADIHANKPNARETGIIEELLLSNRSVNPQHSFSVQDYVFESIVRAEKNIDLYLNTRALETKTESDRIVYVDAVQTTTEKNFDCTGK